jgi:hypothetical protein
MFTSSIWRRHGKQDGNLSPRKFTYPKHYFAGLIFGQVASPAWLKIPKFRAFRMERQDPAALPPPSAGNGLPKKVYEQAAPSKRFRTRGRVS